MDIKKFIIERLSFKEKRSARDKKLLDFERVCEFVKVARALGKTVALDEGTWDLTHAGHVQHIRSAEKFADLILLRLASAKYARLFKGEGRPIEVHRDLVVSEFEGVDAVWVDETAIAPEDVIENAKVLAMINPDVITLEKSDEKLRLKLESINYAHTHLGSRVRPVVFELRHLNSTTAIIQKILKQFA